jgi:hypothetical protein
MKKNIWPLVILFSNLMIISLVAILFLNWTYPMVGHDYRLGLPSMLDTFLHYRENGLGIQWYTPSFGGGLPVFPNPNSIQFSLLSLLTLFVQPLQSVMISSAIYILAGGLAVYFLLIRVLKLHWTASVLGAIFFSANGFMIQRIAVGHLGYLVLPLIAILMFSLLDSSIPWMIGGIIFALVVTLIIHQAGYFLLFVFVFSFLITIPIICIYRPNTISWKRLLFGAVLGGGLALVMSASKLAAVFAFMRFFPRQVADFYPATGILNGLYGISLQLFGTMTLAPIFRLVGSHPALLPNYLVSITGAHYGYWEFDMSVSPVIFVIILLGIISVLIKPGKYIKSFFGDKKWVAWIFLILMIWTTIEFTLAKGLIYPLLQKLPVLSSLHVNPRFASSFLFPLALIASIIFNGWVVRWSGRKSTLLFLGTNLIALIPLCTYFLIKTDLQERRYDVTKSQEIYNHIRSGDDLTVTGIVSNVENTDALLLHQSNLQPYEPIFGYQLENFHPEITPGSIWDIKDGFFNMTNPSGYVFPELNATRPFERIPVSEKDKLEAFANHKQPDWNIPIYQQILDWVSGLTVLAGISLLGFISIKQKVSHSRQLGNIVLDE